MAGGPEHSEILQFRNVPLILEHTIDDYQTFYDGGNREIVVAEKRIESSDIVFKIILKCRSNSMHIKIQYVSRKVPEIVLRDKYFVAIDNNGEHCNKRMFQTSTFLWENRKYRMLSVCKLDPTSSSCNHAEHDVYTGKITFRITGSLIFQDTRSGPLSLSTDVVRLLNDDETNDITLNVDDQMFTAHKFILSARSPVFRAMLMQCNTKESHENTITITDTEPDAFEQFLHFLYTDQVSDLPKFAPDLLILADKYNVDALKQVCEHSMIQNINIENCAEYCVIGDLTNANRIYEKTLEFIKDNLSAVMKSEGWLKINSNMNAVSRLSDIIGNFAMEL